MSVSRRQRLLLLVFLVVRPAPAAAPADPIAEVISATCRLTNGQSSGTGFLLAPPADAGLAADLALLVTAAHTWEGMSSELCTVVLRTGAAEAPRRFDRVLRIRATGGPTWSKAQAGDVAARLVRLPAESSCRPLPAARLASLDDFASGRIRCGLDCWTPGYPAQLEANEAGVPVLRRGIVATVPIAPLAEKVTFLADSPTFGGDSGAPVLIWDRHDDDQPPLLAGVILGMVRQTDRSVMPFEERVVHHPLGLAIVGHAGLIRQAASQAVGQPAADLAAPGG